MNKTTKILLGVFLSLFLVIGSIGGYIMSAKFTGERFENGILAQDETMQNTWAMTSNQLKQGGLTIKNYTEHDLKKMELAMQRYADKPNLMMIWAKEQGNTLTPELHKNLMDTINKIATAKIAKQDSKIAYVQQYRDWRTSSMQGTVANIFFKFPSAKVKAIEDRIITNKATKKTWDTGNDEVEDLF